VKAVQWQSLSVLHLVIPARNRRIRRINKTENKQLLVETMGTQVIISQLTFLKSFQDGTNQQLT